LYNLKNIKGDKLKIGQLERITIKFK
jgi:hypothetical protein